MWDSLPKHLHYRREIWTEGYPPGTCLMIAIMQLTYLQTGYQIHRILQIHHPRAGDTLIEICAEAIDTLVHLGGVKDRAHFLNQDNSYVVNTLLYINMILSGLTC